MKSVEMANASVYGNKFRIWINQKCGQPGGSVMADIPLEILVMLGAGEPGGECANSAASEARRSAGVTAGDQNRGVG